MPDTTHTVVPEGGGRRGAPRILIAGLGNEVLRDDGVGVHAARLLAGDADRTLRVVAVGTAVIDALHLFEWADIVLAIDAMQAGGRPGTVYHCATDDVLHPGMDVSLHELSLTGALRLLDAEGSTPRAYVLGVEPGLIDYGLDLTAPVASALPRVVRSARRMIADWRAGRADVPATVSRRRETP